MKHFNIVLFFTDSDTKIVSKCQYAPKPLSLKIAHSLSSLDKNQLNLRVNSFLLVYLSCPVLVMMNIRQS